MVWCEVDFSGGEVPSDYRPLLTCLHDTSIISRGQAQHMSDISVNLRMYHTLRNAARIYFVYNEICVSLPESETPKLLAPNLMEEIIDGFDPREIPADAATCSKRYYKLSTKLDEMLAGELLRLPGFSLVREYDRLHMEHRFNRLMRFIGFDRHYPSEEVLVCVVVDLQFLIWTPTQSITTFAQDLQDQLLICAQVGLPVVGEAFLREKLTYGRESNPVVAAAFANLNLEPDGLKVPYFDALYRFQYILLEHFPSGIVPIDDNAQKRFIKYMMRYRLDVTRFGACLRCYRFHKGVCSKTLVCRKCDKRGHVAEKCRANTTVTVAGSESEQRGLAMRIPNSESTASRAYGILNRLCVMGLE